MLACVVPAYKASGSVCTVVHALLAHADLVVVVDDGCPEHSGAAVLAQFESNPRVLVLQRQQNGGVGAAVKTGIAACLDHGADLIVKVDADGQMEPSYIAVIAQLFEDEPKLGYVKGNRFVSEGVLRKMPRSRLVGNAALSLLAKFATGYWNILDPTNGFVAFNASVLRMLPWQRFADSYFFEMSVLGQLGIRRIPVGEVGMVTIYGEELSSLSIRRVLFEFPPRLFSIFLRRMVLQYFLFDVNLGSLYILFGLVLTLLGCVLGGVEWLQTYSTGHARTAGTVMLAVIPFLLGVQLLSNALMYDVQFGPKTICDLRTPVEEEHLPALRSLG